MAPPPRHAPWGATMRSRPEVRAIRRGDRRHPGGGRTGPRGKSCWGHPHPYDCATSNRLGRLYALISTLADIGGIHREYSPTVAATGGFKACEQ
jgi:hypothetical protein